MYSFSGGKPDDQRSALEKTKGMSGRRLKYGFRVINFFRFRGFSRDLLGSNQCWVNQLEFHSDHLP